MMSTSSISLFAVGQDPRLEKLLDRAKKIKEQVKDLESKAIHLQTVDRTGLDDFFEEFEEAIEVFLKGLVLDLWNAKSSTSDEISWTWLPPDYVSDHRDFLGRLYCTLKLAEQIHEENSQMENIPPELLPPLLGRLYPQYNGFLNASRTDTDTLSTEPSRQHQQDNRHQKMTLLIRNDLAEFSKVFNYYHSRLDKHIQELRRHQKEQQALSKVTSLMSRKSVEQPQPLLSSHSKDPRRQESSSARQEQLSRSRQGEIVLNAKQEKKGSKRKRAIGEEKFESSLGGQQVDLISESSQC